MSGSDVATTWMSRIAMNMPRHMAAKPSQIRIGTGSARSCAPALELSTWSLFTIELALASEGARSQSNPRPVPVNPFTAARAAVMVPSGSMWQ